MIVQRANLAQEAMERALEVRDRVGLSYGTPVNVFDLCTELIPPVRLLFTDYSMEGCYLRSDRPLIKVSALRPLTRRVFNTAHELGHHVFGHGSRIDELQEHGRADPATDPEEFLANAFAGFLLLPRLAVRRAFNVRGWRAAEAGPGQLYAIAGHFGVGFETLVNHLAFGLREIPQARAEEMLRAKQPAIRQALTGAASIERLTVADEHYELPKLDTEVGTHLLLPPGSEAERPDLLPTVADVAAGRLVHTERPGLVRVEAGPGWAIVVRISRFQYSGWSQYRHLEPEGEDE